MPTDTESDLHLEIGYVLFIDIVGYSKLLINEQSERIQELREIVRNRAVSFGRSGRQTDALAYRRWRRTGFSHSPGSSGLVRFGNQQGAESASRVAGADGDSQRTGQRSR